MIRLQQIFAERVKGNLLKIIKPNSYYNFIRKGRSKQPFMKTCTSSAQIIEIGVSNDINHIVIFKTTYKT